MLQKLRREFVVITMALVGLVLVVALGSALVSSYMNQSSMVYSALTHGLREDLDFTPRFGDQGDGDEPPTGSRSPLTSRPTAPSLQRAPTT